MTLEQRIARALEDGLTDAEFDTLSAEADAEPTFRDAGPVPATSASLPLDHDRRGPRVDTRRESALCCTLYDIQCICRVTCPDCRCRCKGCTCGPLTFKPRPRGLYDPPVFGWAWKEGA